MNKEQEIAAIVHQLRAPLTGVRWAIDSLVAGNVGPISDEQKNLLSDCLGNIEKLMSTIQDLLALKDGEHHNFEFTLVNMADIMKEAVKELGQDAVRKHITIDTTNIGKNTLSVMADQSKMRIVMENLVENAIKYTPENGQITLSASKRDEGFVFSVEDTGMGVSSESENKIFTKFYRSKDAIELHAHGSGIGLYLCQQIVQAHGGKIWFEPGKDDVGTAFFFTLPSAPQKE